MTTTALGWIRDDLRASERARAQRAQEQQATDAEAAAIAAVVGRPGELERWADAIEAACRAVIDAFDQAGGRVPLRLAQAGVSVALRAEAPRLLAVSFRAGWEGVAIRRDGYSRTDSETVPWALVDGELSVLLPNGPGAAPELVEHVLRPWLRGVVLAGDE